MQKIGHLSGTRYRADRLTKKLKKHVSLNISASRGRRRMQRSSLEPPSRAASNGGSFILLRPLDAEIFNETCFFNFLVNLSARYRVLYICTFFVILLIYIVYI